MRWLKAGRNRLGSGSGKVGNGAHCRTKHGGETALVRFAKPRAFNAMIFPGTAVGRGGGAGGHGCFCWLGLYGRWGEKQCVRELQKISSLAVRSYFNW